MGLYRDSKRLRVYGVRRVEGLWDFHKGLYKEYIRLEFKDPRSTSLWRQREEGLADSSMLRK